MKSLSDLYQGVLTPASILFPICFGIINYKYLNSALKILFIYLPVSGGINLFAILHSRHNNLPLLHIYTVIEFLFLMSYFSAVSIKPYAVKLAYALMAIFPILCLINVLFFQSKYQYNSYVRPLEGLLLIGYCLNYFSESTESEHLRPKEIKIFNWINTGILLYFAGALFLFIFSNLTTVYLSHETSMFLLNVHDTLVIIMYVLFTIGFMKCKRRQIISYS